MQYRIEGLPLPAERTPVQEKTMSPQQAKLQRVSEEFEALLLNQLLKSMRSAESMIAGDKEESPGSDLHREMMDEQLARSMARSGGLGLAKMLEQQLQQRLGGNSR